MTFKFLRGKGFKIEVDPRVIVVVIELIRLLM